MEQKFETPILLGRKKIFTNYTTVTNENIVSILKQAFAEHLVNKAEENYLFQYIRGLQPVLFRKKTVRPEICNKVVINKAKSVLDFRAGYLLAKPIQYVSSLVEKDDLALNILNKCLTNENKEAQDMLIATDMGICGLGYRLALPNENFKNDFEESPFKVNRIEPQSAFMVYTSDVGNEALLGCVMAIIKDENGEEHIKVQAFSKENFYLFDYGSGVVEKTEENPLGEIPLIEYEFDELRMGAFEPAIPIYDAISLTMSNRLDGVEQFIQALLVFKNVDIDKDSVEALAEMGAIKIKDNGELEANVQYLTQELNQTQVQTLIDCMFDIADDIVGMPVQKSGNGGDNGVAVIYKDGWTKVESKTEKNELSFKKSERQFLKLATKILKIKTLDKYVVRPIDVEIKFTRRNYENVWTKAQTLDLLLKNPRIHPRLAFVYSGISPNPEEDYNMSEEYYQANLKKMEEKEVKTNERTVEQ